MEMKNLLTHHILFGRGRFCNDNPGNVAFRKMIKEHVVKYSFRANLSVKREVIETLIGQAQEQGRLFLVRSLYDGMWYEAHAKLVRTKVSHSLRDARNSAKQQQSLKKSVSINKELRQRRISLTKTSITSHSSSFKQELSSDCARFPLDVQTTNVGESKNEFCNDSYKTIDDPNVRSLVNHVTCDHLTGKRTRIGSENPCRHNSCHKYFEWGNDASIDSSSTDDVRGNQELSYIPSLSNVGSLFFHAFCPQRCTASSLHDNLLHAMYLLNLSKFQQSLEAKMSIPETASSNKFNFEKM